MGSKLTLEGGVDGVVLGEGADSGASFGCVCREVVELVAKISSESSLSAASWRTVSPTYNTTCYTVTLPLCQSKTEL